MHEIYGRFLTKCDRGVYNIRSPAIISLEVLLVRKNLIIKFILTGRSVKVVVDGQSSEDHEINAGNHQGSLLGLTLRFILILCLRAETSLL